ncbi:MAG: DUF2797 domain-containing protein [Candidatus Micrarchaeia archaeon]|jgi:hypothetical protein
MKQVIYATHTPEGFAALQTAEFEPGSKDAVFGEEVFAPGTSADLPLNGVTCCAGWSDDAGWHKCPSLLALRYGSQCKQCSQKDAHLECARCDGSVCLSHSQQSLERCAKPHVLYLASFAGLLKVGISSGTRFETRWMEQGADYACKTLLFESGRTARIAEANLSKELNMRSFVRGYEKIKLLLFDEAGCEEALAKAVETARSRFPEQACDGEVCRLSRFYPPKSAFGDLKKAQSLEGEVLGCKGGLLFLKQGGQNAVFSLKDAVGRLVLEKTGTLSGFLG